MPTGRDDTYTAASGQPIYFGMAAPAGMPAWWQAITPGFNWHQISGTVGPGAGLIPDAYSGMTLRPSDSTLICAAAGGHGDGDSNAVCTIKLSDDAPAWQTRYAGSASRPTGQTYYPDGRPASRHTYDFIHYIESRDAVLLAGCLFSWGPSDYASGPGMDLFSLATNDYLPRYTWPDIPDTFKGVVQDGAGNIWTQNARKFNVSTESWEPLTGLAYLNRFPATYDPVNNRIFNLQWQDGQGSGAAQIYTADMNVATGVSNVVGINASAAFAAFQADAPKYAAMPFCPLTGKYYFIHPDRLNRFYVVTPNYGGSNFDMAIQEIGGAAPSLIAGGASLCKRVLWVPALSGFVMHCNRTQNLYFMRMA